MQPMPEFNDPSWETRQQLNRKQQQTETQMPDQKEETQAEQQMPWYQARLVASDAILDLWFSIPTRFAEEIPPYRITARFMIAPQIRTHLCSATPMLWLEVLDLQAEFKDYDAVSSEYADWAYEYESSYVDWHTFVGDAGVPRPEEWVGLALVEGCEPDDHDDDGFPGSYEMLNFSVGNHLV